jgi:hypothetical protein
MSEQEQAPAVPAGAASTVDPDKGDESKRSWHGGYFTHVLHPHISARKNEGPVKVADFWPRGNPLARFNSRVALLITVAVGSMWCAYLFTLLALVSFPSAIKTGDKIIIIAWIAQTFLQLVLLPIIIVGQNIQARASDKRSEQTYKDAEAVLHEAIQIEQHLCVQDEKLHEEMLALREIIASLAKAFPSVAGDLPQRTNP